MKNNHTNRHSFEELRGELRRWAEAQKALSVGPKAFLMHLANHADDQARAFVVSRHFQALMNISPRTVTYYLRRLEALELIARTGDHEVRRFVQLPLYRLAPADEAVSALLGGPAKTAALPGPDFSNHRPGVSKLDRQFSTISRTSNKHYSMEKKEDASPGAVACASFGVLAGALGLEPALGCIEPTLFQAYLGKFGDNWSGYLSHAFFDRETSTLHPRTGIAFDRLREFASEFFNDRGIQIGPSLKVLANG